MEVMIETCEIQSYLLMVKPTGSVKGLNHGRGVCQKQCVASSTHHH